MSHMRASMAADTMFAALAAAVERGPDRIFLRRGVGGEHWTRADFVARAGRLAAALEPYACGRFAAGLLMGNLPEYFMADLATLLAGGVPVSLYPTSSAEQLRHLVAHAGISVIFTEESRLPPLIEAIGQDECVKLIVVVDADARPSPQPETEIPLLSLADLLATATATIPLEAAATSADPDDLMTIIYTSGTTGEPKGVQLTHRNFLSAARGIGSVVGLEDGDRIISWLPHAHVAERTCHYATAMIYGLDVTTCADSAMLSDMLCDVEPHWFGGFPRLWERLRLRADALLEKRIGKAEATKAIDNALAVQAFRARGEIPPPGLGAHVHADLFSLLRQELGLGRVKLLTTGSAPTPRPLLEYFTAIGLPLCEMYGASETCTYGTIMHPDRIRLGSAGQASPEMEIATASDGEILIRGPSVMKGYLAAPDKDREVLTPDGWYRSGDLGHVDADGYLWITGRKKEVMINASGHNMAPAQIEAAVRDACPLVGHVCAIGEGQVFVTALVTLDSLMVAAFAEKHGTDLARPGWHLRPALEAAIAAGIGRANRRLARVEQIKRFRILDVEWLPGSDELTQTQKLRRGRIAEKYAAEIEDLYHARANGRWLLPNA